MQRAGQPRQVRSHACHGPPHGDLTRDGDLRSHAMDQHFVFRRGVLVLAAEWGEFFFSRIDSRARNLFISSSWRVSKEKKIRCRSTHPLIPRGPAGLGLPLVISCLVFSAAAAPCPPAVPSARKKRAASPRKKKDRWTWTLENPPQPSSP
ncbi:LOW QUALITY PROTEIN: hypothetical protein SETIT_9G560300v2 [Setaria italica]|uniref:Uncharacterized protein n=1 Tax=Setaria italica TaxID=4555 RepID=A0A368SWI5_SETIT|nr:LOW QUALITY PROTEIN: hypothetical protein SETIT_9G560300v2 [Setaria italica]